MQLFPYILSCNVACVAAETSSIWLQSSSKFTLYSPKRDHFDVFKCLQHYITYTQTQQKVVYHEKSCVITTTTMDV
jgi:hypothetical protein